MANNIGTPWFSSALQRSPGMNSRAKLEPVSDQKTVSNTRASKHHWYQHLHPHTASGLGGTSSRWARTLDRSIRSIQSTDTHTHLPLNLYFQCTFTMPSCSASSTMPHPLCPVLHLPEGSLAPSMALKMNPALLETLQTRMQRKTQRTSMQNWMPRYLQASVFAY